MKSILKYLSICLVVLGFASCGGGGGGGSSSDEGTEIVSCSVSENIEDYTSLQSDDVIVKDSDDTVISIFHDSDENKKVCVVSGSAYILSN